MNTRHGVVDLVFQWVGCGVSEVTTLETRVFGIDRCGRRTGEQTADRQLFIGSQFGASV